MAARPGPVLSWARSARYAELPADLATAPRKAVPAVHRLASLPGSDVDDVQPFYQDDDVAVVEAAPAWTDRPGAALGTLLGYADVRERASRISLAPE
ncbi:hypothetical protein [Amycolatopsis sp. cmx-8-4]|uniref:hypothetical protein n=1 Tax=Amycolatopsis sp. cmx-8-4 TaxID=2790947 RepID=UPI00397D0594